MDAKVSGQKFEEKGSQSTSPKVFISYKGENRNFLSDTPSARRSRLILPAKRHGDAGWPPLWWAERGTCFCVFLPQMHNLNPVWRRHQKNPKFRTFYKSAKVIKNSDTNEDQEMVIDQRRPGRRDNTCRVGPRTEFWNRTRTLVETPGKCKLSIGYLNWVSSVVPMLIS